MSGMLRLFGYVNMTGQIPTLPFSPLDGQVGKGSLTQPNVGQPPICFP